MVARTGALLLVLVAPFVLWLHQSCLNTATLPMLEGR